MKTSIGWWASLVVLACVVPPRAHSQVQPVQQGADLSRVQVAVVLTPETDRLVGPGGTALIRVFESALARAGMGSFVAGAPTRFVLAVSVEPLFEDVTQTAPPIFVERARISAVFGDRITRRTVGEFNREQRSTGRTREIAFRMLANTLRLENTEFEQAAAEASRRIIGFFEQQCDAVILEATTLTDQQDFDEAIMRLETVPREAQACHARAQTAAADAFVAMQRVACSTTFAQAQARWAADHSRENASVVADSLGTIPGGSPCEEDAQSLLEDLETVIAANDSTEAKRIREEWDLKVRQYDDAMNLIRQRMQNDVTLRSAAQQNEYMVRSAAVEAARQVGIERARAFAANRMGTKETFDFRQPQ